MFTKVLLCLFLAVYLVACALPTEAPKSLIPREEIEASALMSEGNSYFKGGRFIEAELAFRETLALFPASEYAKANLAMTLQSGGDLQESKFLYEELVALRPLNFDYRFGLARTLIKLHKYEYAIATLNEAIKLAEQNLKYPAAAIGSRNLAVLHFSIGEEEEAVCASGMAYFYKPDRDEQIRHVRLLLAVGLYDQAEKFMATAIKPEDFVKSVGNDPFLFYVSSAVALAKQDYMLALKLARDAQDFSIDDPTLRYELELMTDVLLTKLSPSENEDDKLHTIALVKDRKAEGSATLYWPLSLIKEVYEIQKANS